MSDLIHNSEDGKDRTVGYYRFALHTDDKGVRKHVKETPTLSFIEVGGEAPAEAIRDEEPKKEPEKAPVDEELEKAPEKKEKPKGFFGVKNDTQKGVN